MGLMFRPRRPLMRVAAGATTATVAYKAGQRRNQSGPGRRAGADPAGRAPRRAGAGGGTGGFDGRARASGQAARVGRADRRGVRGREVEGIGAVRRHVASRQGRDDGIEC